MQETWRRDLNAASQELRADLKAVASELRTVSNTLLTLQAQDLGSQLTKLKDVELAGQAKRIETVERDLVKAHQTIKVLWTVGSIAIAILTLWIAWRH